MSKRRWHSLLSTWALLFAGLTNAHAHLHLCFDGEESPAAGHLAEHGGHLVEHTLGDDGEHDDVDVDVAHQALAKSLKHDLYAVLPYASVGVRYAAAATTVAEPAIGPPPKQARPYLRPPLRAPPR